MPTLSFTLSAGAASELNDCFGADYQPTINGQPNPETKTAFARRQIVALLKAHVVLYRKRMAAAAAQGTDPDIT